MTIHPCDQGVEVFFRFYFDANQCGPGFLIVLLNKFKPHNVIIGTQDVIDNSFSAPRAFVQNEQ